MRTLPILALLLLAGCTQPGPVVEDAYPASYVATTVPGLHLVGPADDRWYPHALEDLGLSTNPGWVDTNGTAESGYGAVLTDANQTGILVSMAFRFTDADAAREQAQKPAFCSGQEEHVFLDGRVLFVVTALADDPGFFAFVNTVADRLQAATDAEPVCT